MEGVSAQDLAKRVAELESQVKQLREEVDLLRAARTHDLARARTINIPTRR